MELRELKLDCEPSFHDPEDGLPALYLHSVIVFMSHLSS